MSRLEHDALCGASEPAEWADLCDECRAEADRWLPDTTREDD